MFEPKTRRAFLTGVCGAALLPLAGCGDRSTLPVNADVGPSPQLPAPRKTLIPTVDIAPAIVSSVPGGKSRNDAATVSRPGTATGDLPIDRVVLASRRQQLCVAVTVTPVGAA